MQAYGAHYKLQIWCGCFNVSIEKLTYSNVTWKEKDFTISGGVLNTKNVLIENVVANSSRKYKKSEKKVLFIFYNSVAEIQDTLIKGSIKTLSIRSHSFSAIIIVQNSAVKILNFLLVENSFQNFMQVNKASLSVKNMTLSENIFTARLYSVEESNVKLFEIKFIRNHLTRKLLFLKSNSSAIIQNNTFTENNASLLISHVNDRSSIQPNNVVFVQNRLMKDLLVVESNSSPIIKNNTLTEYIQYIMLMTGVVFSWMMQLLFEIGWWASYCVWVYILEPLSRIAHLLKMMFYFQCTMVMMRVISSWIIQFLSETIWYKTCCIYFQILTPN